MLAGIFVVNVAYGYRSCGAPGEMAVGKPAPRFSLPVLTTEREPMEIREEGLSGDPGPATLLVFVATWSAQSIDELALLRRLNTRYEGRGLRILIVDTEPGQKARVLDYLRKSRSPFPWMLDKAGVAERYGAHALPHRVLVDRD